MRTADLILHNANVLTPRASKASVLNLEDYPRRLVAIQDGKILAIARTEALGEFKGPRTVVIDCHGKTVLPGFIDAHCHLVALAKSLVNLNLGPAKVHSIFDIQREIENLASSLPPGKWIRAEGYNEFYLAEGRHPTCWDLDKATLAHPVKLTHRSGHAHVLNSLALALTGIARETPEPPGGIIERDWETGEPNGLLYDMGDFLDKRVPSLGDDELDRGIKLANRELLSLGISSVQDATPNTMAQWHLFQRWSGEEYLKCRLNLMLGKEGFQQYQEGQLNAKDSKIRLGGVKIILQETTGQLYPSWQKLEQLASRIHQAKLQIAFHAVEETTIEAAYSVLEHVLKKSPRANHRHRIEHCSVCPLETAKRLASLGIVVVTQPAFICYNGERYLKTVPQRQLQHLYPIATLLKAGVKVAAGSDCPVIPPNPLIGIYGAVSRRAETGESVTPEEGISLVEALQMYTENAAYASFEEATKGSITPRKLADLVVLSDDLTKMPIEEIKNLEVEMTIVGGEMVYRGS